jgi:molybdate transport system substrate-binding protein
MSGKRFVVLLPALLLVALVGCGGGSRSSTEAQGNKAADTPRPPATPQTLTVFAAASLTSAFKEIGTSFEASHPGVTVTFNFGASNQLRTQIEQGATADVFASANKKEMDAAVASKSVETGSDRVFVRNRLVVIMSKGNPAKIESLKDLARPKIKLVVADKAVPVGKYALNMLDKMAASAEYGPAFKEQVLGNVVSQEENVKAVVAKVRLGEGDVGIVYVSDTVGKDGEHLVSLPVPDAYNEIAVYPIAPVAGSARKELGREFIEAVLSPSGKAMLAAHGFQTQEKPAEK